MNASPRRVDLGGLALLGTYVVGWVGVIVMVAVLTAVLVVVALVSQGVEAAALGSELQEMVGGGEGLPAWVMVAAMGFQLPLMWALAPASHMLVGRTVYKGDTARARPDGWRGVHATYRTTLAFCLLGVAGGFTMGLLPGWIAEAMRQWAPSLRNGSVEGINAILTTAPMGWRVAFAIEVAIIAPVVEELVFRGFFWDALKRFVPLWAVWVLSSLIFAAYHMDPVQSTALILTGLALGWIRWTSGSIWPAVCMHMANNGLAVLASQAEEELQPMLSMALTAALFCSAMLLVAAILRFNRDPAFTDAPLLPEA